MAQNAKSLVRLQAHDITLAQQIHCACPVPPLFHDLTAANAPTNAPSPGPVPTERIGAEHKEHGPPTTPVMARAGKLLPQW